MVTTLLEVSTATPSRESAMRVAESVLSLRPAAGQVTGPIASLFWHAGVFGTGEK
ncbi:MAG: hypothetical protein LH603_06580 [Pseudonocardia sp.]|nr:hypothetical protein [Pseudonocardia sp.]